MILNRKIIENVTRENEFKYDNDSWVRVDTPYTIYYTNDMEEFYISDSAIPRSIYRFKGKTPFSRYKEAASDALESTKFATPYEPSVTKKNKKAGVMYRYFVRQANNKFAPIIEIKDSAYSSSMPYYSKLKIKWLIVGEKSVVSEHNYFALQEVQEFFNSERFNLDILKYWQHELTKREETLKRLHLL